MNPEPPIDLDGYDDVAAPEVVGVVARRFRRRLLVSAAAVAVLALSAGFLIAQDPADTTPRGRLEHAAPRHEAGGQIREGSLSVVVLEAGRISDGVFGLHLVAVAEDLDEREALELSIPINTLIPAPGQEPADLPSVQLQTLGLDSDGYGPGRHVVQAWVLLPAGTRAIPVVFMAGVPLSGAPPPPPAAAEEEPPAGEELRRPDEGDRLPLPPNVEGTGRHLGTVQIDLQELGIPDDVWR